MIFFLTVFSAFLNQLDLKKNHLFKSEIHKVSKRIKNRKEYICFKIPYADIVENLMIDASTCCYSCVEDLNNNNIDENIDMFYYVIYWKTESIIEIFKIGRIYNDEFKIIMYQNNKDIKFMH